MIDQQQQRDTADERATRAELEAEGLAELSDEQREAGLVVAAVMGTFAMHQHRAFFMGAPFDPPPLLTGGFLRSLLFSGEMITETGGRIPFADMTLDEPPYVDPAELPDWMLDCPFNVVMSVDFTDEVPF